MQNDEIPQLRTRIQKLERQQLEEYMTLVEIMSNATFFGDLKKTSCQYAKQGQCTFYALKKEARKKIPLAAKCRVKDCPTEVEHFHLEISNLTCALCPNWKKTPQRNKPKASIQVQKVEKQSTLPNRAPL